MFQSFIVLSLWFFVFLCYHQGGDCDSDRPKSLQPPKSKETAGELRRNAESNPALTMMKKPMDGHGVAFFTARGICFATSGDEDGGPGFVGIVLSFDTKRLTAQAETRIKRVLNES